MKLTKLQLREIIREELQSLDEALYEGVVDKFKDFFRKIGKQLPKSYLKLSKKYQKKATDAFFKASEYSFSDLDNREASEADFMKFMAFTRYYEKLDALTQPDASKAIKSQLAWMKRLEKKHPELGNNLDKLAESSLKRYGSITKMNESSIGRNGAWNFQSAFAKAFRGKSISGWKLQVDSQAGTFIWTNPKSPNTVFATPYWEAEEKVPVDVIDDKSGDEFINTSKKLKYTGDFKKDMAEYLKIMNSVFRAIK